MTPEEILKWIEDLKAERVQDRLLPKEVPMTPERIINRAAASGYEVLTSPTAIRKTYRFADFDTALDFVATDVRFVAAQLGLNPEIEIDRGEVTVTLGLPMPPLLAEADFDFADALQAIAPSAAKEPEVVHDLESSAEAEADRETDCEPTDGS